MNIIDQVNLCTLLMKRLDEAVKDREIIIRGGKAPWGGYDFPEECPNCGNKTKAVS